MRIGRSVALASLLGFATGADAERWNGQQGIASFYDASKKIRLSAAHRTLPFGTKVRVIDARNGRSIVVTINDRGPFIKGRVIDLSRAAAAELDMLDAGIIPVRLERAPDIRVGTRVCNGYQYGTDGRGAKKPDVTISVSGNCPVVGAPPQQAVAVR